MTRDEITAMLRQGRKLVTFSKIDGTIRKMPCTLAESLLPPATKADAVSQRKVREISPEVMVVWCTDRQAWRSFRVDNVLEITDDKDIDQDFG